MILRIYDIIIEKGSNMREIHLQVNDDKFDIVLSLLKNLKDGLIQNLQTDFTIKQDELEFYIQSTQFQKDKQEIKKCLQDHENGKSKPLTKEEYNVQMDEFLEKLKVKYADS